MKTKNTIMCLTVMLFGVLAYTPDSAADTVLSWTITKNPSDSVVEYCYTFTYPRHDPSYFIFETSSDFGSSDISNVQVTTYIDETTPDTTTPLSECGSSPCYEINTFTPDRKNNGGKYQTMPEEVYGVKIEIPDSCTQADPEDCDARVEICFDSTRLPVCGDFYSRCGKRDFHENGSKPWNSAFNTGFTGDDDTPGLDDTDTGTVPDCDLTDHIIVPDTTLSGSEDIDYSGSLSMNAGELGGTGEWQTGPTLVDLSYFTATPSSGSVLLEWETASEIDNYGFNIWRSAGGVYMKINAALIPAADEFGAYYSYTDTGVVNGTAYEYILEDMDVFGNSWTHGPVSATPSEIMLLGPEDGAVLTTGPPVFAWTSDTVTMYRLVFSGRKIQKYSTGGWTADTSYSFSADDWADFTGKVEEGQVVQWYVAGKNGDRSKAVSETRSFTVQK